MTGQPYQRDRRRTIQFIQRMTGPADSEPGPVLPATPGDSPRPPDEADGGTTGLDFFLPWFVRLRWAALAGAAAVIAIVRLALDIPLPYGAIAIALAAVGSYNAWFHVHLSRRAGAMAGGSPPGGTDRLRLMAIAQISLDLIALAALIHLTGGLENPLLPFFLFHVVLSGIILDRRDTWVMAGLAALLLFGTGLLEAAGVLAHHAPEALYGGPEPHRGWLSVIGRPAALSIAMAILLYLVMFITEELAHRRRQIVELTGSLRRRNEALQRIDTMRQRLLAVASHDLKAPLATVSGLLGTIKDGHLGPVTEAQHQVIDRSLGRLEGLRSFISDVLSLTAIETGQLRQSMTPIDLSGVIGQAVETYGEAARAKGQRFRTTLPDTLPVVLASPERMRQVFENLLSNAVKYTPEGGTVTVTAEADGAGLLFSVSDTGIGMEPDDLAKLFSDFFRAPGAKKKGIEGTGLGLSIVKRIVDAHQGRIWAESEPGRGTIFQLTLPAVSNPAAG